MKSKRKARTVGKPPLGLPFLWLDIDEVVEYSHTMVFDACSDHEKDRGKDRMKEELILRPFEYPDADAVLSWCGTKHAFRLWSADRYRDYPACADEMWEECTGQGKFPMVMTADGVPAGFILLRYPSEDHTVVRFGFIIVDASRRGQGYGREMILRAADTAKKELGAKKITLGVFRDNLSAVACYRSAGFRITEEKVWLIDGEDWDGYEMELICT